MRTFLILLFIAVAAAFVVHATRRAEESGAARTREHVSVIVSQRTVRVQAELGALRAQVEDLAAALATASNELARADDRVAREREPLEPLRDKIRAMSAQEITFRALLREREEKAAEQAHRIDEATARIATLETALAQAEKARAEDVAEAEARGAEAVAAAEAAHKADLERVAVANKLVDEVRTQNQRLQRSVATAHGVMSRQNDRIKELEAELAALRAEQERASPPAQPSPDGP